MKKIKTGKLTLNKEKIAELSKNGLNDIKGGKGFQTWWKFCPRTSPDTACRCE